MKTCFSPQQRAGFRPAGMRTLLLLVALVMVSLVTRAQEINRLYWYFDSNRNNQGSVQFTPATDLDVNFSVPTTSLAPGLHTLNISATDNYGRISQVNHKFFLNEPWTYPDVEAVEYFFDNDPGDGSGTAVPVTPGINISNLTFEINLQNLSYGVHHLYIRGKNIYGKWSLNNHRVILHEPSPLPDIVSAEYFFDTDPGEGLATAININPGTNLPGIFFEADMSALTPGIHHLFIRGKDAYGKWSLNNHRVILCEPAGVPDIVNAEYFFDTDPGEGSGIAIPVVPGANLSNLAFEADLTALTPGIHHLFIRAKDGHGKWSMNNHRVILCEPRIVPDIVSAEYFIDTDPGAGMGTEIPVTPSDHIDNLVFSLDMSQFTLGNHTLFLRAKDAYGKWSQTNIAQFVVVEFLHNLNLVVFLEGLYTGNGVMNQAQGGSGPQFAPGIADQVIIELHNAGDYSEIDYTSGPVDLSTSGNVSVTGIPYINKDSYYVTVRHRNSIETTSAVPVSFAGAEISYDFSAAASQAYGNNLRQIGSVFVVWSGDANQDGIVDGADMSGIYNSSQPPALTGYNPEDINGDGIVDGADMSLIYNNSQPPPVQVIKP